MDTKKKLGVAFLWHMHQPFYKDTVSGKYLLPWVRLHGVKDYFPMAAILENFDNAHATFNFVPSLVEQINDYAHNDASDTLLDLTVKRATALEAKDKIQILNNFFSVNQKRFIEPQERYSSLFAKRGASNIKASASKNVLKDFTVQDFLDLQVLFNIAWFHSISIDDDINLRDLVNKKMGYTEEDKDYVVFKQKEILAQILPLYKKLKDAGRIEISVTPYYHPILPLICDTSIAKESRHSTRLPKKRFSHPEDALRQIKDAIKYHTEQFGSAPKGMWPSEGSVSDEALELIISSGIDWVATDEDILFKTLSLYDKKYKGIELFDRRIIYQPYKFKKGSKEITMIFRDKNLSDMISFAYNAWNPYDAAMDLLGHFKKIADNLRRDVDRGIVAIVMDGENAWDFYEDNGRKFFETLYGNIDKGEDFCSTTVKDYLDVDPARKVISNIFPGSWINHNFDIWIGEDQDNLSWRYLDAVRKDLAKATKEFQKKSSFGGIDIEKAWRELYISEGSDWNWWYKGKVGSGGDEQFDRLYRVHLKNIYKLLKKPVPDFLKKSIV